QLVAYVLPSAAVGGNAAELVQELRVQLSGRLPASMLPTHIMIVSEFPLTASGKLDRKALPEPVLARSQELTAPSDALQAWLVGQWSELLGETRIGVHDNVFELGGTSLMCAQLIGRIREHLGTDVPLVRLFEHPSIAALALHLGALAVEATSAASAPAPDAALDRARERATRQRASLQRPPARKPR
ncbi:MAG TPA: phosphopantetheine-binding protein, partial [Polyangiales bacterium]